MRTTIDGAGRIVVPKAIRDELGLSGGQELELSARGDEFEMDIPAVAIRLEDRGGVLVAVPDHELPPLTADEVRDVLERTRPVIAVDASVVIAAFATWHEAHEQAALVVAEGPSLPAPVALEVYAVLTRMPPPHRVEGSMVRDYLRRVFPGPPLTLPRARQARLIDELVDLGISGGASYDAAIATVAAQHGCHLATLDRRARATYDRVGVSVRELA